MLVDVHTHLDDKQFEKDLDKVISRIKKNFVVINNGVDIKSNRKTLELSNKHSFIKASLGLHPVDALKLTNNQIDKEINFISENKKKIISIGEIGLDYHWIKENKDKKREIVIFEKMLSLAEKIKKPAIIHSRKAVEDVLDVLTSFKVKIVLHSFEAKKKFINKAIEEQFCFSVPPSIIRSDYFQKLVSLVPVSLLLTESDAPYLGPYKNKRNEPSYVVQSIKKISEIKRLPLLKLESDIYKNYTSLFV